MGTSAARRRDTASASTASSWSRACWSSPAGGRAAMAVRAAAGKSHQTSGSGQSRWPGRRLTSVAAASFRAPAKMVKGAGM